MNTIINLRGNTVESGFIFGIDRYVYDEKWCTAKKGWVQYDTNQDASYFGVWVHPEKMIIKTFAAGDTYTVTCKDEESYHAELKNMAEVYGAVIRNRTLFNFYYPSPLT